MPIHQFILPHLVGNEPITTDISDFIDDVRILKLYVESNDKHIAPQHVMFTWIPQVPDVKLACFSKTQLRNEEKDVRKHQYDKRNNTISHALVGNDLLALFGPHGKIRVSTLMHADLFSDVSTKTEDIPSLSKEVVATKLHQYHVDFDVSSKNLLQKLFNLVDLVIESIQRHRTLYLYHSGKDGKASDASYTIIHIIEKLLALFPVEIANRISFSTHRAANRSESYVFNILGVSKGDQSLSHLVSSGEIYYDLDTDTSSVIKPTSYSTYLRSLKIEHITEEVLQCDQDLIDEAILDGEALISDMIEKLNFITSLKFKLDVEAQLELLNKRIAEFLNSAKLSSSHQNFFIRYIQTLADQQSASFLSEKYLAYPFDIIAKHPKLLSEYQLTDPLLQLLIKMMDENQVTERLLMKKVLSVPLLCNVFEEELKVRIKQKTLNLRMINIQESELIDYLLNLVIHMRVKEMSNRVLFNAIKDLFTSLFDRKVKLSATIDKKFLTDLQKSYQSDPLSLVSDLSLIKPEWLTKHASIIFDTLYQSDVTTRYLDPKERHFSDLIRLYKDQKQTHVLSFYIHNALRIYTDSRTLRDPNYHIIHLSMMLDPSIMDQYEVAFKIHELLTTHMELLYDKFLTVHTGTVEESTQLLKQAIHTFSHIISKHTNLSKDILTKLSDKTKLINERLSVYQHWSTGIELKKKTLKALNRHIYSYESIKEEGYTHELIDERLKQRLDLDRMIEIDKRMRQVFDEQRQFKPTKSWVSDLFAGLCSLGLGVLLYYILLVFVITPLDIPSELVVINYALYGVVIFPFLIYLLRLRYKHFLGRMITILCDTVLWYLLPLSLFILSFVYLYRL